MKESRRGCLNSIMPNWFSNIIMQSYYSRDSPFDNRDDKGYFDHGTRLVLAGCLTDVHVDKVLLVLEDGTPTLWLRLALLFLVAALAGVVASARVDDVGTLKATCLHGLVRGLPEGGKHVVRRVFENYVVVDFQGGRLLSANRRATDFFKQCQETNHSNTQVGDLFCRIVWGNQLPCNSLIWNCPLSMDSEGHPSTHCGNRNMHMCKLYHIHFFKLTWYPNMQQTLIGSVSTVMIFLTCPEGQSRRGSLSSRVPEPSCWGSLRLDQGIQVRIKGVSAGESWLT